jgi:hypothetical protein
LVRFLVFLTYLFAISSSPAQSFRLQKAIVPGELITPETRVHPVDLGGEPAAELVLVTKNKVTLCRLGESGYTPVQTLLLPLPQAKSEKIYYGFARLTKGSYNLVVLGAEGAYYFPAENGLLSTIPRSLFSARLPSGSGAGGSQVQYYDLAIDLDNDGEDELLLPEAEGFSILRRTTEGVYRRVPLPRPAWKQENLFHFSKGAPDSHSHAPVHNVWLVNRQGVDDLLLYDANGDKLQDLIYSSTATGPNSREVERYDVFLQQKDVTFASKPAQSLAVPYDGTADATFRDLNQDRKLDAILVRSNMDIINPRTLVKFYIGSGEDYQVFSKESDRFVTKDPLGLVQVEDFNADGMVDFAMTFFSYQFGSTDDIVDLALGSKIRFKLQFFLGRGARGFNRQPDAEKEITLSSKIESYRGNSPVMITPDLNGDHMHDLIIRSSPGTLSFYPSQNSLGFGPKPSVEIDVLEDAIVTPVDLNADGLMDILVSSAPKQALTAYLSTRK